MKGLAASLYRFGCDFEGRIDDFINDETSRVLGAEIVEKELVKLLLECDLFEEVEGHNSKVGDSKEAGDSDDSGSSDMSGRRRTPWPPTDIEDVVSYKGVDIRPKRIVTKTDDMLAIANSLEKYMKEFNTKILRKTKLQEKQVEKQDKAEKGDPEPGKRKEQEAIEPGRERKGDEESSSGGDILKDEKEVKDHSKKSGEEAKIQAIVAKKAVADCSLQWPTCGNVPNIQESGWTGYRAKYVPLSFTSSTVYSETLYI